MKLSNAVYALFSLSSLVQQASGSNSVLRQRVRNDQEEENTEGEQLQQQFESSSLDESLQIEDVDVGQPFTTTMDSMPKAGTVIPGSYIVRMGLAAELLGISVHEVAESLGVSSDKVFEHTIQGFVIENATEAEIAEIAETPGVSSIEPDTVVTIQTDGRPPVHRELFGQGYQEVPYGVDRVNGGRRYLGDNVAYVVDTGIDRFHFDLNVDVDRGRSFVSSGRGFLDDSIQDTNGHGTHVAGTIAAKDNAFGVVGVAPGATVVPIKVLGGDGSGTISGVILGVDYVAANANPGDVMNLSLGGGVSNALDDAVAAAANAGVLVAVAAGNDASNAGGSSPARVNAANLYTISAVDSSDRFASFSNFGNPPVDFAAPGVAVLSTYLNNGYAELSGTSMAAPHMAGVLLQLGANRSPGFRGLARDDQDNNPDRIVFFRVLGGAGEGDQDGGEGRNTSQGGGGGGGY